MTSLNEFFPQPLYFFDQPARPPKIKKVKVVHVDKNKEEQKEKRTENGKQAKINKKAQSDELPDAQPQDESCEEESTEEVEDASTTEIQDPLFGLKRDAPHLLNELGRSMSQHKWTPSQVGDILNYTWAELRSTDKTIPKAADKQKSSGRKKKSQKKEQKTSEVAECAGVPNEVSAPTNPCTSPTIPNQTTASSTIQEEAGEDCFVPAVSEETPSIETCQWVVERLQATRSPQDPQAEEQEFNESPILCHYLDETPEVEENKETSETDTQCVVNGFPQIPEVSQRDPSLRKFHYRISDGTSFIYYPSGHMAVCHSHSGLPSGGFYTNVFTDNHTPIILATITMYGHGHVTHPVSSVVTAVWDQHGGFMCDRDANMKKEWSWKTEEEAQEKIVVKLSKGISVRLHSGTSALLCFKCEQQKVQIPLSAVPYLSKEPESGPSLLDGEGMPGRWRKGNVVMAELKKIQLKAQDILDAWLDFYLIATGIKRRKKKPKTSSKTKHKKRKRSSSAPAKKSSEKKKPAPPKEVIHEQQLVPIPKPKTKHKPKPKPKPKIRESPAKNVRPLKQAREYNVTQVGPLRIHGNIKQESVILPGIPDPRLTTLPPCPTQSCFPSSVPLTVCPPLLRAALLKDLKEQGPRRCCCSTALMPVLTDTEYDAFIMGQPKHSQQILVVYVTLPVKWEETMEKDAMQRLYRRTNRNRTMPCTQCQMDSFRLVRYEVSTGALGCPVDNILLQHRHNVSSGMILMYIRGTLMFLGYVSSGLSFSILDLQKQILRTREDYRSGVSLPPDYKFSERPKVSAAPPEAPDANKAEGPPLTGRNDTTLTHSGEKECLNETCD
ncbi:uncharacterized protein C3orf20-like [Dunckerocampus dactyliophorus]|uniref:uncharacterized protein C3orf20-like n=1 Tax=Dunckerocampus dactyliophorus TaxID=161453 RepID=UPI002405F6A6|nr:uncharacterized protein C3orf20-like [Dunckerocampus dactyliophorus]XP_054633532.1 uncharacterized protein C3orf20-like [Dunckerocampus dactyliophorus]XP_054633533.1 uncharacterized protein C3orf20-like [Dunckerocampus dactyliophorus]XP_054633534.1 uncharacterized protein C3orf20-like [Dunckerocampus dactyliophorus]